VPMGFKSADLDAIRGRPMNGLPKTTASFARGYQEERRKREALALGDQAYHAYILIANP
jgi:hypothetical protein